MQCSLLCRCLLCALSDGSGEIMIFCKHNFAANSSLRDFQNLKQIREYAMLLNMDLSLR